MKIFGIVITKQARIRALKAALADARNDAHLRKETADHWRKRYHDLLRANEDAKPVKDARGRFVSKRA